jgi:hypothetical protein
MSGTQLKMQNGLSKLHILYDNETCLLRAQNQKKKERVQMRFLRSVLAVIFRDKSTLAPVESSVGILIIRYISLHTNNFPCFLQYLFPTMHFIE